MKKLLTVFLACVLIAAVFLSCGKLNGLFQPKAPAEEESVQTADEPSGEDPDVEEIQALADRCRAACNEMDADSALDCLTPSAANPLRSMMKVTQTLGGDGDGQVMDLLCQALGAGSSDREQVCKTLDTELSDIKVDGDEATATLHYTYEENGKRYGADADVTFERIDGQWYISKLQGK